MANFLFKLIPLFLLYLISSHQTRAYTIHVNDVGARDESGYKFFPMAEKQKCFSFLLRGTKYPSLLFSATPIINMKERFEIMLQYGDNSMIRIKNGTYVSQYASADVINKNEWRGFWVSWTDNLLRVGKSTESKPFLQYQVPGTIPANYMGILSYVNAADWILHSEPKCGPYDIKQSFEAVCDYQKTPGGKK